MRSLYGKRLIFCADTVIIYFVDLYANSRVKCMDEQKLKTRLAAITSTGVILLVVLMAIWIFQLVRLSEGKKVIEEKNAEIQTLLDEKSDMENRIEIWTTDWKIDERARELGWLYKTNR